MASDCYQIKVLHYLNPHLIWAQVVNISNDCEFTFEQIGLYGVLPMLPYVEDECIKWKHEPNLQWTQAAIHIMDKAFKTSSEVWFSPVSIESGSSIFDNNIHIYGEIFIKKTKEDCKKLSRCLVNTGFAIEDEGLFLKELSLGNLHTKLDHNQTKVVVENIENFYAKTVSYNHVKRAVESLKKQTSLFCMAQSFKSALMLQNSENFKGVKLNITKDRIDEIIENKLRDFNLCKGADDISIGRGNTLKLSKPQSLSSLLLAKRLKLFKESMKREHLLNNLVKSEQLNEPNQSKENEDKYVVNNPRWKQNTRMVTVGPAGANIKTLVVQTATDYYKSRSQLTEKQTRQGEGRKKTDIPAYTNSDLEDKITNDSMSKSKTFRNYNNEYKLDLSKKFDSDGETKALFKNETEVNLTEKEDNVINVVQNIGTGSVKARNSILDKILKMRRIKLSKTGIIEFINLELGSGCNNKNVDCVIDSDVKKNTAGESEDKKEVYQVPIRNSVNPLRNVNLANFTLDNKLDSPVLMVHSKHDSRIIPHLELKEICFNSHIRDSFKLMGIWKPLKVQTVSWHTILRGLSFFMIGPPGTGKTMGYVPAVCRLVADGVTGSNSVGPISIILCATSKSVAYVEELCRYFLSADKKVSTCYSGLTNLQLTNLRLNECDLLICTPPSLIRMIFLSDLSVDLRRLSIVVFDDYQRLTTVYSDELKVINFKINEMLKRRARKEWKIQYIISSRVWCESMAGLAKTAPNTVICISALEECILYSKAKMEMLMVQNDNKINLALDFLESVDSSKKTVIVCNNDNEVEVLEKALLMNGYNTCSWNSSENSSKINSSSKNQLKEPVYVCCDSNLSKMNVTDAYNLLHYSTPHLFPIFCKRFSMLIDNYASIFKTNDESIVIKILIEECNTEQLPRILYFYNRCNGDVPGVLNDISKKILVHQDLTKAKSLTPLCGKLLSLGDCPDFWDCRQRHTIFKEYDEPKYNIPKEGVITFNMLHYHSAVAYSAILLTNTFNGVTTKYAQTCKTLLMGMDTYYSKTKNRKPISNPIVGGIYAVSNNLAHFVRCQVIKVIDRKCDGNPNKILIKLLDEEKFGVICDVDLYDLPKELADIDTHVIQVRLVNIRPKDQDTTFCKIAQETFKKIEGVEGLYFRGKIVLAIGNCVFVDNLEACQDLTETKETIVKYDLKKELMPYVVFDVEHVKKLMKFCQDLDICKKNDEGTCPEAGESVKNLVKTESEPHSVVFEKMSKNRRKFGKSDNWAQLDEDLSNVYFLSAENPSEFFVSLEKYADSVEILTKDIQDYVNKEKPNPVENMTVGDIVLATYGGDPMYYRARIDEIMTDKVKCFYVDDGDWGYVSKKHIISIPDHFVTALPFQAIECRLVGIKPFGEEWTEFCINWFIDRFYENNLIYVKLFKKTPAVHTGDYRYDVAAIDTHTDKDIIINHELLDLNLAQENEEDIFYLQDLKFETEHEISDINNDVLSEKQYIDCTPPVPLTNTFLKQPIRSVPLVQSDDESDICDVWDFHASEDFKSMFAPQNIESNNTHRNANLPAIANAPKTALESSKVSEDTTSRHSTASTSTYEPKVKDLDSSNISDSPSDHKDTLDSDDLTSPEKTNIFSEISSVSSLKSPPAMQHKSQVDLLRKPKLIWLQNKKEVIIKIELMVEKYSIEIKDRYLKFEATTNNGKYGFDINLYGIVVSEDSYHSDKGLYVRVTLKKYIQRKWLTLSRDSEMKKWIVYDVESINTSSSEEEDDDKDHLQKVIGNMHINDSESEIDDDEFIDDLDHRVYKSHFN